jgi:type VI secretion system secreted protein VgrG
VHTGQAIGVLGGAVKAGEGGLGLQLIAAKEAIDVQAQADELKVQARDALSVISANAHVDWAAAKRISLSTAGGANITIEGGNITVQCPGKIAVHAGRKSFNGPNRINYRLSIFPESCGIDLRDYDEQFHLVSRANLPITNARYRITSSAGEIFEGVTDYHGYTERIRTHDAVDLVIEIMEIHDNEMIIGSLD